MADLRKHSDNSQPEATKSVTQWNYKDIHRTDRVCNLCDSPIGVIHGVLSDTYYCRNVNCYSVPYSEINEKGKAFCE